MLLIVIAVILLSFAVLGGLTAATLHLGGYHAPLWVALIHGGFALPGVGFLAWFVAVRYGWGGLPTISLVMFILAAAGGIYMFLRHGRKRPLPRWLVFTHGATALVAYVLLIVYLFW